MERECISAVDERLVNSGWCSIEAMLLPPARRRGNHGLTSCAVLAARSTMRALFSQRQEDLSMKSYMCVICGYVYEEEKGDPNAGIAAGTRWEDVPLSWRCPDCGAGKEDFEMVEI